MKAILAAAFVLMASNAGAVEFQFGRFTPHLARCASRLTRVSDAGCCAARPWCAQPLSTYGFLKPILIPRT